MTTTLITNNELLIIFGTLISTLLLALAGLIIYIWKTHVKHIDEKFQHVEQITTDLKVRVDKQQEEIKEIRDRVIKTELKIDILIAAFEKRFGAIILSSESPLGLTDYGKTCADGIDAEQIVKPFVDSAATETEGKLNYLVQEHCFHFAKVYMLGVLEKEYPHHYEVIMQYAYEEAIDPRKLMDALGLVLRDAVFKKLGRDPYLTSKNSSDSSDSSTQADKVLT